MLNETIAMELDASISCMGQYVILESTVDPNVKDTFKDILIEKLKRGIALGEYSSLLKASRQPNLNLLTL